VSRRHFHARVVLLDWDGTLLDSYAADVRAYLAMFRALEIEWGIPELESHYSPDWYQVYRAAKVPRARWEEADRLWRKAYLAERPALLPGARAALRALKQRFVLGLVTSGSGGQACRRSEFWAPSLPPRACAPRARTCFWNRFATCRGTCEVFLSSAGAAGSRAPGPREHWA
jgi:Haloacid dehalogenase-like hydrolase